MNKILISALFITAQAMAQTTPSPSEEAIILNQELQFLEERANNVTIISASPRSPQERAIPIDTESLEQRYFGNELEDDVATRAAAPRRQRSANEL